MKVIVKRSKAEEVPYLSLDIIVELGDHSKQLENILKESNIKDEDITEEIEEHLIRAMVERVFESKISEVVEKVVDALDNNPMLEFGMPDVEVESMPLKIEDLEKSPFHLSLKIPYDLIALPMMEAVEKAIEDLD